jgi:hypothetical protein
MAASHLGIILQDFALDLHARGHALLCIQSYGQIAEHFSRWLAMRHLVQRQIDESVVERFLCRHLSHCHFIFLWLDCATGGATTFAVGFTRPFSLALTCCTDLLSENWAIGIFQINAPVFWATHRTPDFQFNEMLTAVVHQGDRFHDQFISVEKELIRGG